MARNDWGTSNDACEATNQFGGKIIECIVAIIAFVLFLVATSVVLDSLGLSSFVDFCGKFAENHIFLFLVCAYIVFVATILTICAIIRGLIKLVGWALRSLN